MHGGEVGEQLRALRERAGISGRVLAGRAHISQSKISKIERGHAIPSVADVRQLAMALRLSDDVTQRLVSRIRMEARIQYVDHFRHYCEIERPARRIDVVTVSSVPALFQTPEYFRHLLQHRLLQDQVASAVSTRLERQSQRFNLKKTYRCIVSRSGLLRFRGSEAIWRRQVDALIGDCAFGLNQLRVLEPEVLYALYLIEDLVIFDGVKGVRDSADFSLSPYDRNEVRILSERFEEAWRSAMPVTVEFLEELKTSSVAKTLCV